MDFRSSWDLVVEVKELRTTQAAARGEENAEAGEGEKSHACRVQE